MKKDIVVGINCSYFTETDDYTSDGNIAIMIDGKVVLALAEERISRKKYDGHFHQSLRFAFNKLGINESDVSKVVLVGFAIPIHDPKSQQTIKSKVHQYFSSQTEVIYIQSHHEAHAWSAIGQLGGDEDTLIAVLDHSGSIIEPDTSGSNHLSKVEQTSYYLWRGGQLQLVCRDHDGFGDLGYGRFYSKISRYIGFSSYHDAGKTMGLASFYDSDKIPNNTLAYQNIDGHEVTTLTHAYYSEDGLEDLKKWFYNVHGLRLEGPYTSESFSLEQMYLAAWAQKSLNVSISRKINFLAQKFGVSRIYTAGGVALNSVMNQEIEKETGISVSTPSSPGDAGLSYGALTWYSYNFLDHPLFQPSPFLGPIYSHAEIKSILLKKDNIDVVEIDDPAIAASKILYKGKIIAWYQDRSEFGPRALGNRSILSSPQNPWAKELINNCIKKREWFRPFAPSVLEDESDRFFLTNNSSFEYMMKTADANPDMARHIPSTIHIDGSARLQTVQESVNPKYYKLIKLLSEMGHPPVVLNTSFNIGGMPLVETPDDALSCFLKSENIDALIIDNFLITRKNAHG